jgi:hypothetical protein
MGEGQFRADHAALNSRHLSGPNLRSAILGPVPASGKFNEQVAPASRRGAEARRSSGVRGRAGVGSRGVVCVYDEHQILSRLPMPRGLR